MSRALMLRTCAADMSAYGGFTWPASGPVEAPDWDPVARCGGGLHGLLWGRGDYSLLSDAHDAKWLVVEIEAHTAVEIGGKIKVPRGNVVYCGTSAGALGVLRAAKWGLEPAHSATSGDAAHSATSGNAAHSATSGYAAHSATSGDYAHSATSGDYAHSATSGDYAHSATSGKDAIAAALGADGRVKSSHGPMVISYRTRASKLRVAVAYPGEGGIKPDTWYQVNASGKFVEVKE